MKAVKITLIAVAAVLLAAGVSTTSYAFHSGGVAECGGCHSMHSPAPGGSFLLIGSDASSTCLSCHEHAGDTGPSSYHVSTADADMPAGVPPKQRTPGGDFGWLKKTYTFTIRGTTTTEEGQTHGHNIVAADKGYTADTINTQAPGGSYPATALSCTSCHDKHGQYRRLSTGLIAKTGEPIKASGSYTATTNEPDASGAVGVYRLLAGAGYQTDGVSYIGVPAAKVPGTYNRTESTTQTRTAYGNATSGGHVSWGAWCQTCHADMHLSGAAAHPVDQTISSTTATNYAQYVMSGNMTGTAATSFTSLVPFIEGTNSYTTLATHAVNDDSQLGGPSGSTDLVSCMSCHRAHASGWEHALRWNMEGEFMVYNSLYPGTDTTPTVPQFARGRLGAETLAAYYDRPVAKFASYQRVLCNKCHAKD